MPKPPAIRFDHSMNEAILLAFFYATTPVFDHAMGKRLSIIRRIYLGMTQRQLADKLGLTQADVCRLENGKMINAPLTCAQFKSVLGEHLERLLVENGYYRQDDIKVEYNKQIRKYVGSKRNSSRV